MAYGTKHGAPKSDVTLALIIVILIRIGIKFFVT